MSAEAWFPVEIVIFGSNILSLITYILNNTNADYEEM
jgi:hypothetical protein